MQRFDLMGRFIALSDEKVIPASEAGKNPVKKREIYLDTTSYDMYTHAQIGEENKILLEFGGDKMLDKAVALRMQKDDVVKITFGLQGNAYKDKQTGRSRVFTAIRCLDIEVVQRAGQMIPAGGHQPAAQPAQEQGQRGYDPAAMPPTAQPSEQQPAAPANNGQEPLPF